MTKLVWRADGVAVKEYPLHPGLNRIGRAATNDVRIDDRSVSAQHCELWVQEDSLIVRDLRSTNGTFVNGRRVAEAEIGWGQLLVLGAVEFGFHDPPVRVAIPAAPVPEAPAPVFLADGTTPCCANHAEVPAAFRCEQCAGQWCPACVRVLRRIGGRTMVFCTSCGGAVVQSEAGGNKRRPPLVLHWLDRIVDNFRPRPKYPSRSRRPR